MPLAISAFAANNPPIPPPTMTTWGRDCTIISSYSLTNRAYHCAKSSKPGKHRMHNADSQRPAFISRPVTVLALALLLLQSALIGGSAQDYPDRPVKIIVPFAAGGTA